MKKIIVFSLIFALSCVWILPVLADQLTDAKNQKNNVDSKINNISKQKQKEQKNLNDIKAEKKKIDNAQQQKSNEVKQITGEIKENDEEIKTLEDGLKDSQEKLEQQKELFRTRIRVMYENSNTSYVETLVEAKSISDFLQRLELISIISKNDKQLIAQINSSKKDIEYKKQKVEDEKLALQKKAKEKIVAINTLQVSRASADEKERKIKSKLDQLEQEEDELNRISDELTDQIKNYQSKGKYAGGTMTWPVPSSSEISSGYGNRLHPILKKYRMHTGIDISASSGKSIVAANNGTVKYSGWQSGYGNTVIIDHGGGITTLYAHCSKLLVSVGDSVKAGDVIAKVGSTGLSTGPHLHFEVRKDGATTDPTNYVSPS